MRAIAKSMLFLMLSLASTASLPAAADSSAFWSEMWSTCHDVHTPGFDERIEEFKKYLREGNGWEKNVEREISDINHIINKTCVSWAADPNGSQHLADFRKRYGEASSRAISISDKANGYLLPTLKNWTNLQIEECANFISFPDESPIDWNSTPCGQIFILARQRIEKRMKEVTDKFNEIRRKCPVAADEMPMNDVQPKVVGAGAPGIKNKKDKKAGIQGSDITGTEKAIQGEKKSRSIIKK